MSIDRINNRDKSKPLWLHLTYQAVHTGNHRLPPSWEQWSHDTGLAQSLEYRSAVHVLDVGLANLTQTLKDEGMWDNTLLMLTADNGGDCGLLGGDANNWPLLGRKCTSFDGGTRAAGLVTGGLVPEKRWGSVSDHLYYITDWYPTFCGLAGVSATDDWTDPSTNETHPIDGVDIWESLINDSAPPREWLPTTERSILWDDGEGHLWKLITDEYQSNRFHPNGSQYMDSFNPCLNESETKPSGHELLFDAVLVPPSCTVCSEAQPCLFEVRSDPSEQKNFAKAMPEMVQHLANKLASYVHDVSHLGDWPCAGHAFRRPISHGGLLFSCSVVTSPTCHPCHRTTSTATCAHRPLVQRVDLSSGGRDSRGPVVSLRIQRWLECQLCDCAVLLENVAWTLELRVVPANRVAAAGCSAVI